MSKSKKKQDEVNREQILMTVYFINFIRLTNT